MRELTVTQNITVDGVVEAADWFTVNGTAGTEDLEAELMEQAARADAILTGRTTFEELRGYWPQQTGDTTDYLNQVQKYVVSTTLQDPEWEPTTILRDLGDIRRLKESDGRDIVCTGSITLVHALIQAGLVDEYRLFVYPTAYGSGRKLFPQGPPQSLRLDRSVAFRSGVALLVYRVVN